MRMHLFALGLVIGVFGLPARAQFWDSIVNPDVTVTLLHPPGLGLKVQRVAFAPVSDNVTEDLVSACISDLSNSGQIEVLDRGNIEKILKEQKFANSGLVDEKTAVELGRLLGSPVLLFVKVQRQDVKHTPLRSTAPSWTDKKGKYHPSVTTYTSKTQVEFNASIQAVDLASGRIYSQQRIAVAPSRETSSDQGQPQYPSETEVIEMAIGLARTQVHQMVLPWNEQRKLIFYDDKDYGMKDAYKRLQLNETPSALQKSTEALNAAKGDPAASPKYLGRTNYNVGICHFILGDYRSALPFLKAARETAPDHKIFAAAEAECQKALGLAQEMTRVDARSGRVELDLPKANNPASPGKAQGSSSVEERLMKLESLKKKGLISPQEYKEKKSQIMSEL